MAPTSTPPKYIQQLIESNEKLFIELKEIRKVIKEIKEIIASTTHPANSSLLIPHYSNNICKYPVPHRRSSPKTNISILLKEVFPSEEQREKIEDKYRSMASSALKACKAFILRKNNEGTPWKEIASLDKLQLVKHTADLIVSVSDEMTFVYDCEKLWPAAFLVKSCWTNKAKNYNEKMSKVINSNGNPSSPLNVPSFPVPSSPALSSSAPSLIPTADKGRRASRARRGRK